MIEVFNVETDVVQTMPTRDIYVAVGVCYAIEHGFYNDILYELENETQEWRELVPFERGQWTLCAGNWATMLPEIPNNVITVDFKNRRISEQTVV